MNKKILIFSIFLIALFVFSCQPLLVSAQGRRLEVTYPFTGGSTPQYISTNVTEYANYIFNFLLWGSGIFALIILIIAGFGYLTSAGDVGKMSTAKSRIWAALGGLGILFGSYIILTTINPQLIFLNLPILKPLVSLSEEGVWLCKENPTTADGQDAIYKAYNLSYNYKFIDNLTQEQLKAIQQGLDEAKIKIKSDCYLVTANGDIRSDFDNKAKYIYFVPDLTDANACRREYGAIVYEGWKFTLKSDTLINHLSPLIEYCQAYDFPINFGASSIKPFRLLYEPDPAWGVALYEQESMNKAFADAQILDYFMDDLGCESWWCEYEFDDLMPNFRPKSLEIFGEVLAILINTSNNKSATFSENVNNLTQNLNITEKYTYDCIDPNTRTGKCIEYLPAADKLILISGAIY